MKKELELKDALEDLSRVYLEDVELEVKRSHAVVRARLAGASWQAIGDTHLITAQTMRRHYAHVVEELHPTYTYPLPDAPTGR